MMNRLSSPTTTTVFKKLSRRALVMAEHTQTLRVSACRLGPCLPMTFTIDWLKPYHTRRGGVHQKSGGRQLTRHVMV